MPYFSVVVVFFIRWLTIYLVKELTIVLSKHSDKSQCVNRPQNRTEISTNFVRNSLEK